MELIFKLLQFIPGLWPIIQLLRVKFGKASQTAKSIPQEITENILPVTPMNQWKGLKDIVEYPKAYLSACYLTSRLMILNYKFKLGYTLVQFWEKCKANGAIVAATCFINDNEKLLDAAGAIHYDWAKAEVSPGNFQIILDQINANNPLQAYLDGHAECIIGWRKLKNGEVLLDVIDPGWQYDTFIETTTMRFFKYDKNGNRVYSIHKVKDPKTGKVIRTIQRKLHTVGYIVAKSATA